MRKVTLLLFLPFLLNSCVSAKVYKDLEARYESATSERDLLSSKNQELEKENHKKSNELIGMSRSLEELRAERDQLAIALEDNKRKLGNLQDSYDALEQQSSKDLTERARMNRELLEELQEKQRELDKKIAAHEQMQKDLEFRSGRIADLEAMIAGKEADMRRLKDAVAGALLDFAGKGLSVEQRDGKVYVSMENKLLFSSGSWTINAEGRRAVQQLAGVLANNPEIAVLIEGHTDDVPYRGSGSLEDNWDLSVKRATAFVKLLMENPAVDPANLTAAGKGKYAPLNANTSVENKAKNRRIEVVLTPKLDQVTRLLGEL